MILDLFLKSWAGTLTLSEEEELNELLAEPEWAQLKKDLENDRFIMGRFKEYEKYDSVADFSIFLKRIRKKQKQNKVNTTLRRVIYSAACVIVFVMAGVLWLRESNKISLPDTDTNEEMIAVQQIIDRNSVRLVLPDNQVIALSKKTELIPILHLDSLGVSQSAGLPTLDYTKLRKDLLKDTVFHHTLIVPWGEMRSIILSDGSRVTLNAKSMLKYPVIFTDSIREVYVEGEALFEVKKDNGKPFIAKGKDFSVNVLGTTFNVMSYDEEPMSQITLLEGKVETSSGTMEVILKPGEQASIFQNKQIQVDDVDTDMVVAWVDKKIDFNDERLDVIMRKICRWYDVQVLYETPAMRERRFTGVLLYDNPLEVFLDWLSTTTDMQFTLSDGVITIKNFKNK